MRASECAQRFVFLSMGGVRVLWACGAELTVPGEIAQDVYILADKYPVEDHAHRRLGRKRRG